ncbi:hypothetical protein PBPRA3096 [Photobacterium profundum SS9]|uniref:Uncharacterized protein n=1 Tax=Photobacterium profundum (strain SS9) TaxID=298386 RepID=Q6LMR5_PHOPR|nr:hypothetical protein PBPRA3096 [Photobacterium profundum SS9]
MQTKIAKKTSVNTQLKHSSMKTFMSVSTMYDSRKTAKFLAKKNNFLVIVRDLFITMAHYILMLPQDALSGTSPKTRTRHNMR